MLAFSYFYLTLGSSDCGERVGLRWVSVRIDTAV